ncbi:cytochrome P450 [Bisporella sp. PMI_857]|nr:cytochrome P450 [Bisporella sp. PMI_857]
MASSLLEIITQTRFSVLFILGSAVALLVLKLYLKSTRSTFPLPPGPKGQWIIGNFRQANAERPDIQFAQWSKEYNSDVIYFYTPGQSTIVLNSAQSAIDLLDKRGTIYSDRPSFGMIEALGFNNLALKGDGAEFRRLRKVVGNFLTAQKSLAYRTTQLKYARVLVRQIMEKPENWKFQLSRFATSVILETAFGIECNKENEHFVELANKAGDILSNNGNTGAALIDMFPPLQKLPRWAGRFIPSVKYVHEHTHTIQEFHQRPLAQMIKNMEEGTVIPCFLSRIVEAKNNPKINDEAVKRFTDADLRGTGGLFYAAGQDTTLTTLITFILAMIVTPEVQIQAQKEIDAVTGGNRLPVFEDWDAMPIISRIISPTLPNGLPHKTLKEDVYRGMRIPKGAMIFANAWAMGHDPQVHKDPFKFNPRYLPVTEGGLGEPLPVGHFGFGRRICPGQYLGFASAWIAFASLLATFDISKAKNQEGKEIEPKLEFSTGITSHPLPFPCVFTPRLNSDLSF